MRIENINGVTPQRDLVVVDIQPREEKGLYLGGNDEASKLKVEMYYGFVEALGPQVNDFEHCPGLRERDIAIFSQFAGSHIATNDKKLHKILRGYDIMATTTDLNKIDEVTLSPTADRILIKSLKREVTDGGLFLTDEDARDPRLADINYGEVVRTGPSTSGAIVSGDTVAYDLHVGEALRERASDDKPELRVIREDDILFINR